MKKVTVWLVTRFGFFTVTPKERNADLSKGHGTYATKDQAKAVASLLRHYGHRARVETLKVDEDFTLKPMSLEDIPSEF
jgi:hypothetical protein